MLAIIKVGDLDIIAVGSKDGLEAMFAGMLGVDASGAEYHDIGSGCVADEKNGAAEITNGNRMWFIEEGAEFLGGVVGLEDMTDLRFACSTYHVFPLVERSTFYRVGGFYNWYEGVGYEDVCLCLRITQATGDEPTLLSWVANERMDLCVEENVIRSSDEGFQHRHGLQEAGYLG